MDLEIGQKAAALELPAQDGARAALGQGGRPQVLFFFKVGCPTSPLAVPAIERLRELYAARPGGPSLVCVSQDPAAETRAWADEHGLRGPFALDDGEFAASRAFGLVAIPTAVVLDSDGKLAALQEGWSRAGYDALAREVARLCGMAFQPIAPRDGPEFRPG
jgi:peroxiredoxin